ncbi:MAG: VOC family protein [Balneolaceae bacterium]
MSEEKRGIHHISIISGDGQRNAEFYVSILGLRMVLKTVNQDDPGSYHLFYANGSGQPGSSITFFPWPDAIQGKTASGQATAVSFAVPDHSVDYWIERLGEKGMGFEGPFKRFGKQTIRFSDPDGLQIELVFDSAANVQAGWEGGSVPAEAGIRGFWSSTLRLDETEQTAAVLKEVMGFKEEMTEGNLALYQTKAPIGHSIITERAESPRYGRNGRGIVHHIAFRMRDGEELEIKRQQVIEMGLSPTGIIDRHVFKSVYFQSPGGILFEMATEGPGYLSVVQEGEEMGKKLFLPPWLEPKREAIEKRLPPITV